MRNLIFLLLVLALVACQPDTNKAPEISQCYTLEYLHVSGSTMVAHLELTSDERANLHAASDEGSYFLTTARYGTITYKSEQVLQGATAILSIKPCK